MLSSSSGPEPRLDARTRPPREIITVTTSHGSDKAAARQPMGNANATSNASAAGSCNIDAHFHNRPSIPFESAETTSRNPSGTSTIGESRSSDVPHLKWSGDGCSHATVASQKPPPISADVTGLSFNLYLTVKTALSDSLTASTIAAFESRANRFCNCLASG